MFARSGMLLLALALLLGCACFTGCKPRIKIKPKYTPRAKPPIVRRARPLPKRVRPRKNGEPAVRTRHRNASDRRNGDKKGGGFVRTLGEEGIKRGVTPDWRKELEEDRRRRRRKN